VTIYVNTVVCLAV